MIVLAHGWGFDATIWDDVCGELCGLPTARVDLGFFGAPQPMPQAPEGAPMVCAGHSLGFPWLLRNADADRAVFVTVNSFARFTGDGGYPGVSSSSLKRFRRQFERDAAATLSEFRMACGAAHGPVPDRADIAKLLDGLDWLAGWDERAALGRKNLAIALAGTHDAIVSAEMSRAAFAEEKIVWVEGGGHALPLQHPKIVADAIRRLYETLA